MIDTAKKYAGRVLTPDSVAKALCQWAISSPADVVLDLGVGEGVFALAAFDQLRKLGGSDEQAAGQIHGAELDREVFSRAQAKATQTFGREFPNIVCADFHDIQLPAVDAVVGNPPYIRRHYQLNAAVLQANSEASGGGFADAYCYFLIRASKALRSGGRLAVLVSASWLDMRYGRELKRVLTEKFRVHLLLGFEGKLFTNALVKPVVILAEKTSSDEPTFFAQVPEAASLDSFQSLLSELAVGTNSTDLSLTRAMKSELSIERSWSAFFKNPELLRHLVQEADLRPLRSVAKTRIGLQTFAKRFFVLGRAEIARWGIEPEFIAPFVFSPRYLKNPLVDGTRNEHYVFACDRPLMALTGTGAARYVTHGAEVTVRVRGKTEIVTGYHQAPRLARARRAPWYNLKTEIERRGAYPILLPRRVFKSCLVAHNRASMVVNEDFIEVQPLAGESRSVASLLAFFNSHLGEFVIRSYGFQYGGGVFNLNPGAAREIPVVDPSRLSASVKAALANAWDRFVAEYGSVGARNRLNEEVAAALRVPPDLSSRIDTTLDLLTGLAAAAQRPYRTSSLQYAAP